MRRFLVVVALAAFGLVIASPNAQAHAVLRGSEPASGASVPSAPASVLLRFNEQPDAALSQIQVLDASGRDVARSKPQAVPSAVGLRVALPKLPDGAYTVSWRVVSTVDGHLTAGVFGFGVGQPAPVTPVTDPGVAAGKSDPPSAGSVGGRFLLSIGLALLLGAVVARLIIIRRPLPSWTWALPLSLLAAWAGLGLIAASEASRAGVGISPFLQSERGASLIRVGMWLASAAGVVVYASRRPTKMAFGTLGVVTIGAMFIQAQSGHAGAVRSTQALQVAAQTWHLIGIGAWIGGLVWLLGAMRASALTEQERSSGVGPVDAASAVVRFAKLASVAIVIVFVTGTIRSFAEVGSWSRLASTTFGATVLVKLGLFTVIAALGARNHFRIVPKIAQSVKTGGSAAAGAGAPMRALRSAVRFEVAVAVALFVAAGLLTELPPSVSTAKAAASPRAKSTLLTVSGADFATSVRASLALTPGAPGPNALSLTLADFDTGERSPADAVTLILSLPARRDISPVMLPMTFSGRSWSAQTAALGIEGRWNVTVQIARAVGATRVDLVVPILLAPMPVDVSRAAGQPTLYTAKLRDLGTVQVYADPEAAGPNGVHVTAFDSSGDELALGPKPSIRIITPGGVPIKVVLVRVSAGHYTVNATLPVGTYRVILDSVTAVGAKPVVARIEFTIPKEAP